MNRLVLRVAGQAVLAGAAAAVPGCVTDAGLAAPVAQQAHMVSLMLGSAMGTGPLTEAGLIYIVETNGGGYVTAIARSGRAGTASERTTVYAVLGTSTVEPGGTAVGVGSPVTGARIAVLCYRFTVGYYPYQVWQAQQPCPQPRPGTPGGYAEVARAQASQVYSAQSALAELPRPALARVRTAPVSLSQARHLLGLNWQARRRAGILPLTATGFATGRGRAALALRLRHGGCVYLSVPDDPASAGLPGPWLSPVHAPCTGAAALAASGWISVDPARGG